MAEKTVVAIDLGGTFIKSALVSESGHILKSEQSPTHASESADVILSKLQAACQKVYNENIVGVGLGAPGWADPLSGALRAIDNIKALEGVSIKDFLKKIVSCPVFIDNDANNAAKGEYLFGPGQGKSNFMALTLGTGIGGGLVLNKKFFRGKNNYAGEIGHMSYIPDGAPCTCGKRGCLEAYASATAIIRSAKSIRKRKLPSALLDHPVEEYTPRLVCDLAKQGDLLCQSIVRDAAKALGTVIASVINLLDLECVALGGGIAAAGDVLLAPLRLYALRQCLPLAHQGCDITTSPLGNNAALLGCAASAFMELS